MKLFIIVFLILSSSGFADEKLNSTQAKAVMSNVYESFVKIIPYIYSDKSSYESLKLQKNQEELIGNLNDISAYFKGAKHIAFFQKPGFRPSLETINSHLDETILSIQSHNLVFAQSRLKAVTALCVSCHTQISEVVASNAFGESISKEKRARFESDFAFANYLFLVRRFTEAINYFEMSINTNLTKTQSIGSSIISDDGANSQEIVSALRRVLSVYTKINFNPEKAIIFLKKYQSKKNLSKQTRESVSVWIKSLEKWKSFDPHKMGLISEFIIKNLRPLELRKDKAYNEESDVTFLVSSGILSKYLVDNPKSELAPEILYWLSIAEKRLTNTYFFSLSDLYLKDCITRYSKSTYAKKCYQEYEDGIIFGYSGSGGTDIPTEEKLELERLKKALK